MDLSDAARLHDDLMALQPDGARHDADTCPFCLEKAAQQGETPASGPSGSLPSGAASDQPPHEEGGTTEVSDNTITQETHQALLEKALKDATADLSSQLSAKTDEASALATDKAELETKVAELAEENTRLNSDLDKAQVELKAATDEVASLKSDIEAKDEAARKAEIASARASQVENLGLFSKDYIGDKASKWADLAEEDWAEKLEEWRSIKPATAEGDEASSETDSASAMSGTSEELTTEPTDEASASDKSARRAALGLTS